MLRLNKVVERFWGARREVVAYQDYLTNLQRPRNDEAIFLPFIQRLQGALNPNIESRFGQSVFWASPILVSVSPNSSRAEAALALSNRSTYYGIHFSIGVHKDDTSMFRWGLRISNTVKNQTPDHPSFTVDLDLKASPSSRLLTFPIYHSNMVLDFLQGQDARQGRTGHLETKLANEIFKNIQTVFETVGPSARRASSNSPNPLRTSATPN